MTTRNDYTFADLNGKPALVEEIVSLERRLKEQTGDDVTLIAYALSDSAGDSPENSAPSL
ncbi:hypothetical protein ACFFNY_02235 [Paenibacillus hodogayensis]|uniref:Uncharacterized protein n=1 Tax=Paenibacillus hodogayensis TaxID=279208 RepID=A0ABV5VQ30_9BACL